MPLFFLLAISIVTGLHGYVWLRLCSDTGLSPPLFWAGSGLVVGLYLLLLTSFFAYRLLPTGTARWLKLPAYLWMGFAFYLAVGFALADLLRLGWRPAYALGLAASVDPLASIPGARLAALLVASVATALTLFGMFEALVPGRVRLRRLSLELPRLAGGEVTHERGFRIVQLSDLHIGPTLRDRWLRAIVARVNALEPDLIVLTGDLVDGLVPHVARHAAGFAELRAKHGVYFCTGNHDVYSGMDAWTEELSRLGLRPLRNERVTIGEPPLFELAGVDDFAARYRGGGPDFERALAGRDTDRPVVLLAHQPPAIRAAVAHGVDLQLSGHTHGGQLWPFHYLTRLQTAYRAGLYRVAESWLYVSRGTGFWGPPLRVFAPAEITELTLRPPRDAS